MSADPEILDLTPLYSGFCSLHLARIRLADGAVIEREVLDRGDAAAVLPYDPVRRTALLVRLFRHTALYRRLPSDITEAPAGMLDNGEAPEDAVRREALEETGLVLNAVQHVATVWPSVGALTERLSLFLAEGALTERGPGGGKAEEHENITVLEVPLAELKGQAERGEIEDMKLLVLVQALQLRRPELFA